MSTKTITEIIVDAAQAAARGWADECHGDHSPWTGGIPQSDLDWLAFEILRRDPTPEDEDIFAAAFVAEYDACMEQRAERA